MTVWFSAQTRKIQTLVIVAAVAVLVLIGVLAMTGDRGAAPPMTVTVTQPASTPPTITDPGPPQR